MSSPETVSRPVAREDEGLLAQISAGDPDALGELYNRYSGRAYRVALSVCRHDGQAEDAVQEAFISIWKSRATYIAQRGTVAAWLLTVVRYRAIDLARRSKTLANHRASDDKVDGLPAPDDVSHEAVARADAPRMRALLARLPDAQREVITLAFYGQLTHTEIAAQLGLPSGTVKGRMRLGLQRLRGHVDQVVY